MASGSTARGPTAGIVGITCFSIGGGFVAWEDGEGPARASVTLPFPVDTAAELLRWCADANLPISDVVRANEAAWRPEAETRAFVGARVAGDARVHLPRLSHAWESARAA